MRRESARFLVVPVLLVSVVGSCVSPSAPITGQRNWQVDHPQYASRTAPQGNMAAPAADNAYAMAPSTQHMAPPGLSENRDHGQRSRVVSPETRLAQQSSRPRSYTPATSVPPAMQMAQAGMPQAPNGHPISRVVPPEQSIAIPIADVSTDRLMAIAKLFERQGRLESATSLYQGIMARDPGKVEARERLQTIARQRLYQSENQAPQFAQNEHQVPTVAQAVPAQQKPMGNTAPVKAPSIVVAETKNDNLATQAQRAAALATREAEQAAAVAAATANAQLGHAKATHTEAKQDIDKVQRVPYLSMTQSNGAAAPEETRSQPARQNNQPATKAIPSAGASAATSTEKLVIRSREPVSEAVAAVEPKPATGHIEQPPKWKGSPNAEANAAPIISARVIEKQPAQADDLRTVPTRVAKAPSTASVDTQSKKTNGTQPAIAIVPKRAEQTASISSQPQQLVAVAEHRSASPKTESVERVKVDRVERVPVPAKTTSQESARTSKPSPTQIVSKTSTEESRPFWNKSNEASTTLSPPGSHPIVMAGARVAADPNDSAAAEINVTQSPRTARSPLVPERLHVPADGPTWEPALADLCPDATGRVLQLVRMLDGNNVTVRKQAANELARMGTKAAAAEPAILELLHCDDDVMRVHAARTLWRIDNRARLAVDTLIELVEHPDPTVSHLAAYALGEVQHSEAEPALSLVLDESAGIVRLQAADSLLRLGSNNRKSVTAILYELRHGSEDVRWLAAFALETVHPREVETVVCELTAALRDPDARVRSAAALVLGAYGQAAEGAISRLLETTSPAREPDATVREAAAISLACIYAAREQSGLTQNSSGLGSSRDVGFALVSTVQEKP